MRYSANRCDYVHSRVRLVNLCTQTGSLPMPPKIAIICPAEHTSSVEKIVERHAYSGWRRDVRLVPIGLRDQQKPDRVSGLIRSLEQNHWHVHSGLDAITYVFLGGIRYDEKANQPNPLRFQLEFSGLAEFGNALQGLLRDKGLHWFDRVCADLKDFWSQCAILPDAVERWLDQFKECGGHRWVGEGLLRQLDLWPMHRVLGTFNTKAEVAISSVTLALNLREGGKSGTALWTPLKKHYKTRFPAWSGCEGQILDILKAVEENRDILFFEDGCISGSEAGILLDAIRERMPRAPNGATSRVTAHYAYMTTLGLLCWDKRAAPLDGRISLRPPKNIEEVMTEEGRRAFKEDRFYDHTAGWDNTIDAPERFVRARAFERAGIWGLGERTARERADRAKAFCKEIGRQLYQNLLNTVSDPSQARPGFKKTIEQRGLGVACLALTVAFSHSIPKSTLPVFWGSGPVSFSGKTLQWVPLFPGAAEGTALRDY